MKRRSLGPLALVAALAAAGPAAAQPAPTGDQPPAGATSARAAEQILADYARALGGPAAFKKHKSLHLKRDREIKGTGIRGTEEQWATASGRVLIVTTLPGIGVFKQGSDGKRHWMLDPINGLRLLSGAEAEEARLGATWDAEVRLAQLYARVRVVPPPEDEKEPVECVELTPKLGKPNISCFDRRTHLRVSRQGLQPSPQGDVPYKVRFSDWRAVGATKLPHVEALTAGPVSAEGRVTEVKLDERIDPAIFKLPTTPKSEGGAPL